MILGLPVNESAIGHYRVTAPLVELEAAGRVIARVAYESAVDRRNRARVA